MQPPDRVASIPVAPAPRCVIHYQIPASVDVYVHRSGRTGRAEAEGISIALVTPKESARFLALLKALGRQPPPEFPVVSGVLLPVVQACKLGVHWPGSWRCSRRWGGSRHLSSPS